VNGEVEKSASPPHPSATMSKTTIKMSTKTTQLTTFLPSKKSHFQLPTPEETARQTETNAAITRNKPQTTTTHHKTRRPFLSTVKWSALCY
jgi:hypothetical protein